MNKAELIDAISSEAKITKADANRALDAFMNATTKSLKKGDRVALVGFGTFSVAKRAARNGRNPQTGKPIKSFRVRVRSNYQNQDWKTEAHGNGEFSLDVPAIGKYYVSVWAEDYGIASSEFTNSEKKSTEATEPFHQLALQPELTLTGQVIDENGQPIHGAIVQPLSFSNLYARPDELDRDREAATETVNGKFKLKNL